MSLSQFLPTNRAPPTHSLSGRDTVSLPDETESSLTDTPDVAETSEVTPPDYIYYRVFSEDGAIPSRTPAPSDPFLGRIKTRSVPPPHRDTVKAVKLSIAKVENIKDRSCTSLFLTPYSHSPMGINDKVTRTGPGSTPQEPLAFLARISDSEQSALESRGVVVGDTMPPEIRYLHYLLYVDGYEMPSKVAIYREEPCLGRIRTDFVAPPHTLASIKLYISKVEKISALANADLYADISCNTPLKEDLISILGTDCPGLSPKKPMAIVQKAIVQDDRSISDGRYIIKNGSGDIYWKSRSNSKTVYFGFTEIDSKDNKDNIQWDIKHDTDGNILITSADSSMWVGAEITQSTVPVPWRMIEANFTKNGNFWYHLTTDMNRVSRNPRVPKANYSSSEAPGLMATLREGDQYQMWEFIKVHV